jgi:diguanylate cyclase (GGDEF)-like protein
VASPPPPPSIAPQPGDRPAAARQEPRLGGGDNHDASAASSDANRHHRGSTVLRSQQSEPIAWGAHLGASSFGTDLVALLDRIARHATAREWVMTSALDSAHLVLAVSSGTLTVRPGDAISVALDLEPRLSGRPLVCADVALPGRLGAGLLIGIGADEGEAADTDVPLAALLADTVGDRWASELARADGDRLDDAAATGFDELTGLVSRPGWDRIVQIEDRRLASLGGPVAIAIVVVNDVRDLNDREGHGAGDSLLQRAAYLLSTLVGPTSVKARIRGDVLAVLTPLTNGASGDDVEAALKNGFDEAGLSASIGVAWTTGLARLPEVVRKAEQDADFLRAELDELGSPTFLRKSELATALDSGAIHAYFQPIVELRTGSVVAVEALARWTRPGQVLEPGDFLGELTQHGMLHALFDRILDDGLRWMATYRSISPNLRLAVNVEFGSIGSAGLADQIASGLDTWQLPPSALGLELSERQSFGFDSRLSNELEVLAGRGVALMLDDFGTGFASLETLTRLPIQGIKLDRRFISQISKGEREHAVIKATIAMATELGLSIVAEGIETQQQSDHLVRLGCRLGQGYLLALPLPPESVLDILAAPLIPTW